MSSLGLQGETISVDDLTSLALFQGGRQYRGRLARCFDGDAPPNTDGEPAIRGAVRRTFEPGELICEAGAYGSTAFYLVEGRATATLPERSEPRPIAGRSRTATTWLSDLFARRTAASGAQAAPRPVDIGEVSAHATLAAARPDTATTLEAGALFGVDTCINFYPRERTVRAETRCVVIEMLRSVLDAARFAGKESATIGAAYEREAVVNVVATSAFASHLSPHEIETLVDASALLVPSSDELDGGRFYRHRDESKDVYFVRAGHVRLSHEVDGKDVTLTYVGRGGAFGWEAVFPKYDPPLEIECTSHPDELPTTTLDREITFGRQSGCTIQFPAGEKSIGRQHCRIRRRDDESYLSRWNTESPTLLNGAPVEEAVVLPGDRIDVGPYSFVVRSSALDLTTSGPPPRRATATGLDGFEVVRVPSRVLRRLAEANDAVQAALEAVARSLDASGRSEPAPPPAVVEQLVEHDLYHSQNVLLIDLDRCTRCDECVRACADAHGGVARFTRDGPRLGRPLITLACRSCTDPKCMVGCPVGSIRREDSLQIRIEDWCIGCQSCARQCPFGNINMVDVGGGADPDLTTIVAPADEPQPEPVLRATVCDLCAGYSSPNCVYACPHDAAIRVRPASFLSGGRS